MQYYFSQLGLPVTASLEDIKKAYRTLAKEYHPDLNPNDPQAIPRFQELQRSYEILVHYKSQPAYPPQGNQPPYQGYYQGYPPNYGGYPPYQSYYNYPPQQQAQEDSPFQSYAWETWGPEQARSKPNPPPTPEPTPVAEEPEPLPPTLVREDMFTIAYEEAFRDAKLRAAGQVLTLDQQLKEDVASYLASTLKNNPQGKFSAHSNNQGKTISFRKQDRSLFGLLMQLDMSKHKNK